MAEEGRAGCIASREWEVTQQCIFTPPPPGSSPASPGDEASSEEGVPSQLLQDEEQEGAPVKALVLLLRFMKGPDSGIRCTPGRCIRYAMGSIGAAIVCCLSPLLCCVTLSAGGRRGAQGARCAYPGDFCVCAPSVQVRYQKLSNRFVGPVTTRVVGCR